MTLATIVAGILGVSLNAYALLAGADFGGGVWDLLASGPRRDRQRDLIAHAIGPIWEANHVWLIIVVVVMFTCFPPAIAELSIVLHIPLTLMLIGIVLRGSAFTFRAYDSTHGPVQRRWGLIFSLASVITPVLLGIIVGAIVSGGVGTAGAQPQRDFVDGYVLPWCTPWGITVGVLALSLFAFLAAVYLTVEAENAQDLDLEDDFRRSALEAAAAVIVVAWVAISVARHTVPHVYTTLMASPFAVPLQIATALAGLVAILALIRRRYRVARVAAAIQVSLVIWGWLITQYPYVVPPNLTLADAAAPASTLRAIIGAITVGAVILFPSLWYLFRVFKGGESPFDHVERGK
ncbi:MAG TPA: cytochrome d ubiquinol oxidase subunit II [Gemmatimonadaceae bacterium]|jgi:cytochrome d ubiquinol oxidase subunit II|nr:cytochrome d ubiquinol oxidase subunit II [Gemmatimonadaceae bacterium]